LIFDEVVTGFSWSPVCAGRILHPALSDDPVKDPRRGCPAVLSLAARTSSICWIFFPDHQGVRPRESLISHIQRQPASAAAGVPPSQIVGHRRGAQANRLRRHIAAAGSMRCSKRARALASYLHVFEKLSYLHQPLPRARARPASTPVGSRRRRSPAKQAGPCTNSGLAR